MSTQTGESASEFFPVTNDAGVFTIGTQDDLELDVYAAPLYRDAIADVVADAACSAVVLDINKVSYLDSTNLGVIIGGYRKARAQNKLLVVDVVDNPRLQKIFKITGLSRAIQVIDSKPE